MPTLEFKGKQFVYTHHLSVPFRQLDIDEKVSLSNQPNLNDNLIINGDNLQALKALLPQFAGRVKCIFIDPPYNTGNEGWCYSDKVNSPLMREWLKREANPVDNEDLERHDKWLCMMWPRLQLLKELLAEDGTIWVCIDDNEQHRLRLILDEIFGEENFIANVVWNHTRQSKNDERHFSRHHNTILVYSKTDKVEDFNKDRTEDDNQAYSNPDNDPRGDWRTGDVRSPNLRETLKYDIVTPNGNIIKPPENGWRWKKTELDKKIEKKEIIFNEDQTRIIRKIYLEDQEGRTPENLWLADFAGTTRKATSELKAIFGDSPFPTPKPTSLIIEALKLATEEDSIVLDSFAGSGSTASAVLALNKADGGNRKFILVELEEYAGSLTAERVKNVISGYKTREKIKEVIVEIPLTYSKLKKGTSLIEQIESLEKENKNKYDSVKKEVKNNKLSLIGEVQKESQIDGLGGQFTFCTLGKEIDIESLLKGENLPDYESLARYVYYTATGHTLGTVAKNNPSYFIGESGQYKVHLIYRPDRDFLRSNDSALNAHMVETIAKTLNGDGKKALVFATAKFMSQKELTNKRIEFCQLPYAIHRILGN